VRANNPFFVIHPSIPHLECWTAGNCSQAHLRRFRKIIAHLSAATRETPIHWLARTQAGWWLKQTPDPHRPTYPPQTHLAPPDPHLCWYRRLGCKRISYGRINAKAVAAHWCEGSIGCQRDTWYIPDLSLAERGMRGSFALRGLWHSCRTVNPGCDRPQWWILGYKNTNKFFGFHFHRPTY